MTSPAFFLTVVCLSLFCWAFIWAGYRFIAG